MFDRDPSTLKAKPKFCDLERKTRDIPASILVTAERAGPTEGRAASPITPKHPHFVAKDREKDSASLSSPLPRWEPWGQYCCRQLAQPRGRAVAWIHDGCLMDVVTTLPVLGRACSIHRPRPLCGPRPSPSQAEHSRSMRLCAAADRRRWGSSAHHSGPCLQPAASCRLLSSYCFCGDCRGCG